MVLAGYLSRDLVIAALDREAIEMFVGLVDPLDRAKSGDRCKADDRYFYLALLGITPLSDVLTGLLPHCETAGA